MIRELFRRGLLFVLFSGAVTLGQESTAAAGRSVETRSSQINSTYVLGPDDSVSILAVEAEEISGKAFHIDEAGYVSIPLAGRFRASGLSVDQFETQIKQRLQQVIRNPEVSVTVTEFRSQPVSVLGAVVTPGVQQLRGSRTLLDVIASAGGVRADAGTKARVTRDVEWGPIPLKGSTLDATGGFYVSEVNLAAVVSGGDPQANFKVFPHDVISVETADKVYAIGEVAKPGEFQAKDGALSLLQVLSMAGGINKGAAAQKSMILRPVSDGAKRASLPVDIQKIISGHATDLPMMAGDILFIPSASTTGKNALTKTLESVTQWGTYFLFYGLIH